MAEHIIVDVIGRDRFTNVLRIVDRQLERINRRFGGLAAAARAGDVAARSFMDVQHRAGLVVEEQSTRIIPRAIGKMQDWSRVLGQLNRGFGFLGWRVGLAGLAMMFSIYMIERAIRSLYMSVMDIFTGFEDWREVVSRMISDLAYLAAAGWLTDDALVLLGGGIQRIIRTGPEVEAAIKAFRDALDSIKIVIVEAVLPQVKKLWEALTGLITPEILSKIEQFVALIADKVVRVLIDLFETVLTPENIEKLVPLVDAFVDLARGVADTVKGMVAFIASIQEFGPFGEILIGAIRTLAYVFGRLLPVMAVLWPFMYLMGPLFQTSAIFVGMLTRGVNLATFAFRGFRAGLHGARVALIAARDGAILLRNQLPWLERQAMKTGEVFGLACRRMRFGLRSVGMALAHLHIRLIELSLRMQARFIQFASAISRQATRIANSLKVRIVNALSILRSKWSAALTALHTALVQTAGKIGATLKTIAKTALVSLQRTIVLAALSAVRVFRFLGSNALRTGRTISRTLILASKSGLRSLRTLGRGFIGLITYAIRPSLTAFRRFGSGIRALAPTIVRFIGKLGPVGLAILGIVAAFGLLYKAYHENWMGFRDFVDGIIRELGRWAEQAGRVITSFLSAIWDSLQWLRDVLNQFVTGFVNVVMGGFRWLYERVRAIIIGLAGAIQAAINILLAPARALGRAVGVEIGVNLVGVVSGAFSHLERLFISTTQRFSQAWTWAAESVSNVIRRITEGISSFAETSQRVLTSVAERVATVGGQVMEAFGGVASGVIDQLMQMFARGTRATDQYMYDQSIAWDNWSTNAIGNMREVEEEFAALEQELAAMEREMEFEWPEEPFEYERIHIDNLYVNFPNVEGEITELGAEELAEALAEALRQASRRVVP